MELISWWESFWNLLVRQVTIGLVITLMVSIAWSLRWTLWSRISISFQRMVEDLWCACLNTLRPKAKKKRKKKNLVKSVHPAMMTMICIRWSTSTTKTLIEEDVTNQVSVVEAEILHESAMLRYAIARVEKYRETREHVERRLDCQYRQEVAHALDIYLTSVQQRVHARAETI